MSVRVSVCMCVRVSVSSRVICRVRLFSSASVRPRHVKSCHLSLSLSFTLLIVNIQITHTHTHTHKHTKHTHHLIRYNREIFSITSRSHFGVHCLRSCNPDEDLCPLNTPLNNMILQIQHNINTILATCPGVQVISTLVII